MPNRDIRKTTKRALQLLKKAYGPPPRPQRRRAVDTLVATILSQNTNSRNSSAGFGNLKARFPSWDEVADARVSKLAACIRVSGLADQKAPRIRRILRQIRAETGRVSLEFLRRRPSGKAYDYLVGFNGVGPKTALCVLLFAFNRPVFPVDTHIYRLARRLGLLDASVPPARAHEVLAPMIVPRDRCAMHLLMIAHGRAICLARKPRCGKCCLRRLCPHGTGR